MSNRKEECFMANLFWGKKKIVVVGVNGNPMAKRIVEEMKAQGMKGVVELDAPKAYPDYYALSQLNRIMYCLSMSPHSAKSKSPEWRGCWAIAWDTTSAATLRRADRHRATTSISSR